MTLIQVSKRYHNTVIGIVLAGGTGSRLHPLTASVSKQLLPIFDKPMIHYPIATLMLSGIRKMIIVTTPRDQMAFQHLLGDGSELGLEIHYKIQPTPNGIGAAFVLCQDLLGTERVALILGDNVFHGNGLGQQLSDLAQAFSGAQIFGYPVLNPSDYGVVEIGANSQVLSIEEKPLHPKSNLAIPGLYFYESDVVELARQLSPSSRGEIEITSVNIAYWQAQKLSVKILPRGTAWFDTGTFENLADASSYVRLLQTRQGTKIACLEEISWRNGWISAESFEALARSSKSREFLEYARKSIGKDPF